MRAFCLAVALAVALVPPLGTRAQAEQSKKPPKCKIALRHATHEGKVLWLNVSIKKKHANRDDLLALAKRLGSDLSNYEDVMVFILDDHRHAKSYHPGIVMDDVCEDDCRKALRAAYSFNRAKDEHYLEIYRPYEQGTRHESVRVDLGPPPSTK